MITDILIKNESTGAFEVKRVLLPVPAYEIGQTVGYLFRPEDKVPIEGKVTGFVIEAMTLDGTFMNRIEYIIDEGIYISEEDIDYSYAIGEEP